MIDFEDSVYGKKAMALFEQGYNCSQAVFLAFKDKYDIDESTALKLSSSFGGGMGRLREVCGAVSGMFMAAGFRESKKVWQVGNTVIIVNNF